MTKRNMATVVACVLGAVGAHAAVVNVPDPALDAALRAAVGQPAGDLEDSTLAGFSSLNANGVNSGFGVIQDLTGLEACTGLTYVDLSGNDLNDAGDLAPLAALDNCVTLYLNDANVTALDGIGGMAMLQSLFLADNAITDLTPLNTLGTLTYLDLSRVPLLDLAPLGSLTALTDLFLVGCSLTSLDGLQGCAALKILAIDNNQVASLAPLSGLTQLERLTSYDNVITDLAPLSGLTALRELRFESNQVTSIQPLSALTGLEQLAAYGNFFTDISPLNNFTSLRYLHIGSSDIADFGPLATMTGLEILYLGYGPFADETLLAGLEALVILELSGTQVDDLGPFLGLPALEELILCNLAAPGPNVDAQVATLRTAGVTVSYGAPLCSSGEGEGEGEGEGQNDDPHATDQDGDLRISLSELLRAIQFYNSLALHCEEGTEDGFAPGAGVQTGCGPHDCDYNPQDWVISLSELLRVIQIYNVGAYYPCAGTEDGFCLGIA